MRRLISFLFLAQMTIILHGQIVADHSVVDLYDEIPEQYMNSVKTMLVSMAGQSHSGAYRYGQLLLEQLDPAYHVSEYDPAETNDFTLIVNSELLSVSTAKELDQGHIKLLDLNGRVLEEKKVDSNVSHINLSSLSEGIYVVVVSKGPFQAAKRFIWQGGS